MVIDYVQDIYQTLVEAIKMKKLEDVIDELKRQSLAPMNTMLTKQPREEAIQKQKTRDAMELADVPPTCTNLGMQSVKKLCKFKEQGI